MDFIKNAGFRIRNVAIAWAAYFVLLLAVGKIAPTDSPLHGIMGIAIVPVIVYSLIALFGKQKTRFATFSPAMIAKLDKEHQPKLKAMRKAWNAETEICGLVKYGKPDPKTNSISDDPVVVEYPHVVGLASTPTGVEMTVQAVGGQSADMLIAKVPLLENSFNVEMTGERRGIYAILTLKLNDPLAGTREATLPGGWIQ